MPDVCPMVSNFKFITILMVIICNSSNLCSFLLLPVLCMRSHYFETSKTRELQYQIQFSLLPTLFSITTETDVVQTTCGFLVPVYYHLPIL